MAVETPVQIDVCEELDTVPPERDRDRDNEACFQEEINVYSIPHTRMKRLAQMATDKLKGTNYSIASELLTTVKTLSRVFYEFKTHERIENECIMRRLQAKLIKLNIQNTAVCNCHKDDELSKMLKLFSEGIRYSSKSEAERIKYGQKLEKELLKFQQHFLPHMQEEEDIFQPLLVQYFTVEELKELKESVLKQHQMWNNVDNLEEMVNQYDDIPWTKSNGTRSTSSHSNKTWSAASSSSLHITRLFDEKSTADIESLFIESMDESQNPGCGFVSSKSLVEEKIILDQYSGKRSPSIHDVSLPGHYLSTSRLHSPVKTNSSTHNFPYINVLPSEILAQIFTYLTIRDLCRVSQVCRQWNAVALDAHLWLTLAPLVWISALKDESTRGASWPNIEQFETDSMASLPVLNSSRDVLERLAPVESDDSDSTGRDGIRPSAPSIGGSSQRSECGFKREQSAIASIAYRLVPRIGTRVSKLVLAGSRSITNVLLRRILHNIPNVTYLDVRDTRIGDAAFKFINRRDFKPSNLPPEEDYDDGDVGHCLGRLQYLNLSGCINLTDEGLRLLLATMDAALDRLETECEHSLCSSRIPDNVSVKSGQSALSDVSGRPSLVETQFQGLVIDDDQMQQMRRRQQQQRTPSCRSSVIKKERKETLREGRTGSQTTAGTSSSSPSASGKPWDLESSADDSLRSACASCVECPVVVGSPSPNNDVPNGSASERNGNVDASSLLRDRRSTPQQRPLEYVSLSGCYRLTDDGLLHVARSFSATVEEGLPNLRHLDLSGCMNVSVDGLLPVLVTCPLINFQHLFYCDNVFLGEGIDDLASGCRNLERGRVCCRSGL